MPVSAASESQVRLTLALSRYAAQHIREEVSSGVYESASDYIESMILSEMLFEPVKEDELTRWIETEGVRRLRAMEADPSQALTEEQVFGFLDEDVEMKEVS